MTLFPNNSREKIALLFSIFASLSTFLFTFLFPFEDNTFQSLGYLGIGLSSFLSSATVYLPGLAIITNFYVAKYYNILLIALFIAIGGVLGDLTAYFFGFGLKKNLKKLRLYSKIEKGFTKRPFSYLLIWSALPPLFLYDFVLTLAGSSTYSFKKFIISTFIGRFIRALYFALVGSIILITN